MGFIDYQSPLNNQIDEKRRLWPQYCVARFFENLTTRRLLNFKKIVRLANFN